MTSFHNFLIALAATVSCVSYSSPLSAQAMGMYGGENLELTSAFSGKVGGISGNGNSSGNLGSVTVTDSVNGANAWRNVLKWRDRVDNAHALKGKGRPEIIGEESAMLVELMNSSVELAKEKKYNEALVGLQVYEQVGTKTPEEVFFVQRMRASIAYAAGNEALLATSLEAAIATNQAQAEEQLQFIQSLSSVYARQKDLPKTIAWTSRYLKEGGAEPGMRTRLIRAHYLNNDFAEAARELRVSIAADQAAGKTPAQEDLGLLASAELKAGKVEK